MGIANHGMAGNEQKATDTGNEILKNEEFYNLPSQTPKEIENLIVIALIADLLIARDAEAGISTTADDWLATTAKAIRNLDTPLHIDEADLPDIIERGRFWLAWLEHVLSEETGT